MMDNKLSELSKPVAWKIHNDDHYFLEMREEEAEAHGRMGKKGDGVYSQEYVSALLAELEAKDKRIAELDAKLATPVRFPEDLAQKIKVTGYYEALNEMMDCVRAAGFKCAGDE